MKHVSLFIAALLLPVWCLAQEVVNVAVPVVVPPVDPNGEFINLLIASLGGLKGASTLAIVGIVVQIIIKALNLPIAGKLFSESKGWIKLLIVSGLTLVGGVTGLMSVEKLSFAAALIHSTTLTALMVFGNQLIQHFSPKKP